VKPHVLFELASLLEGFAAHLTREWSFICVRSQVLIKMAGLFESFVALRAFVRAMFSMIEQMFLQLFLSLVHPFAHSAIKGSSSATFTSCPLWYHTLTEFFLAILG